MKDNIVKVDKLHLNDLAINPYLVEAMGLRTPEEIVEFFVNQRFQRGVVTSFGSLFEKQIAGYFGQSARISDVDLRFERGGVTYYVQLKSGPEGFTGPALTKTLSTMRGVKRENPDARTVIAFSYGTKSRLSKVWGAQLEEARMNGDVEVMIGREFWNFVLQSPDGYDVLFRIFEEAGVVDGPSLSGDRRTLENARKDAYERVLKEFKWKYGSEGAVKKLKEDNL